MAVKQLIERVELTSSAASITFSSIPQTFAHLVIVASARNTASTNFYYITFNESSVNYDHIYMQGTGSSVNSGTSGAGQAFQSMVPSTDTANTFSNNSVYILNYTAAQHKSFSIDSVNENNATASRQTLVAGIWQDTTAIDSIKLTPDAGNFDTGTTMSLYGITRGGDGTVTTA